MIPVGWLEPSQDCWDTNMLRRLLDGDLYRHGLNIRHYDGFPATQGCVLVVPGRYMAQHTDQITEAVQRYDWVLAARVSDEEDLFDVGAVSHGNIRWWVQTPRGDRDYGDARLFGEGFPAHFNSLDEMVPEGKGYDVFLSAQNTHERRKQCFDALRPEAGNSKPTRFIHATEGFTEGLDREDYAAYMTYAKVAPCPSGAVTCDSFRLWEALEAHAIPIADTVSPVDGLTDYWERILPGAPFPILTDYQDLCGYVEDQLRDWPASANRITAWFMRYKRSLALGLREDLQALGAV